MNEIQRLIHEMCPNGVPMVALNSLCNVLRGKRLTKDKLSPSGKYPVFHGGLEPLGYYDSFNRPANSVMVINVGASAGTVGFCNHEFWSSDGCFSISHNPLLHNKFLYYYLFGQTKNIQRKVRVAGIPTLDNAVVEKIQIPLPPLPIQQRIVEILDKFTSLVSSLDSEIALRQKQYEYYRNKLLSFEEGESILYRSAKLSDVSYYPKERIDASLLNEENYVSVENLLQNKEGKERSSKCPTNGNWIKYNPNDILIGNIRPYLKKIWYSDSFGGTNGDVLVVRIKKECNSSILPNYLFKVLSSDDFFEYDTQHSSGAKMPRGDKDSVMKYKIPNWLFYLFVKLQNRVAY